MEQSDDVKVTDKLKDSNIRTLDLSNCPEWVRKQNDDELFEIFKIGVAVKESRRMNITGGEKYSDKVEQQIQETQRAPQTKIDEVLVPLKECKTQLMDLAGKPPSKAAVGELFVLSVLEEGLPHHTVEDVSKMKEKRGDIHVTSTVSGRKHLVEVKTHKDAVPARDIRKFGKDLRENQHHKVGILVSLDSGIAQRAKHGKFGIKYQDNQYLIYVPNARKQPDLLVWSVLIADELALVGGPTESQTQELQKLQQRFDNNMETKAACQMNFKSLIETVNALEENLTPLLEHFDRAQRALNKALN